MMATTVYVVLFLAGVSLVFSLLSKSRNPRFAFLAICWIPPAGLALLYALQNQLGYALIQDAILDVVASIVIAGIGANQCIAAIRQKSATGSLLLGTLLAASPLAIFAVLMIRG